MGYLAGQIVYLCGVKKMVEFTILVSKKNISKFFIHKKVIWSKICFLSFSSFLTFAILNFGLFSGWTFLSLSFEW